VVGNADEAAVVRGTGREDLAEFTNAACTQPVPLRDRTVVKTHHRHGNAYHEHDRAGKARRDDPANLLVHLRPLPARAITS
jgi:hypothetical protein